MYYDYFYPKRIMTKKKTNRPTTVPITTQKNYILSNTNLDKLWD